MLSSGGAGASTLADPGPWRLEVVGEGAPVVLVHGLGTDASAWDRVVPILAEHHRVIRVDLPGYSLRSVVDVVPDATALADALVLRLERLGVGPAVFVGHSFGGAVCVIAARRHPQRCAGLALIAPGGFGSELNPLIPLLGTGWGSRLMGSLYGPRTSRTIERLAARVESRTGRDSRVRVSELMETYDRLRSPEARSQFRTSVQQSLALNSGVDRAAAARIDPAIPVLVIWGRDDRVLPSWQATYATQLLPWAVVRIVEGAGHTPHRSHPRLTTREIRAFAGSADVRSRLAGRPEPGAEPPVTLPGS